MVSAGKSLEGSLYRICVNGVLDDKWADWFEGFVMISLDQHNTLLTGRVIDQAALHGILGKIRNLGLELLLVMKMDSPCSGNNLSPRGGSVEWPASHDDGNDLPPCMRCSS